MTDRWSATERIFHAALERPVEARAAFLAEACGGDDALRRDVQSLLDAGVVDGLPGAARPADRRRPGDVRQPRAPHRSTTRGLQHHRAAGPRRHGRGLPGARHAPRARGGDQGAAAGADRRPRSAGALRTGSARAGLAQSPAHRHVVRPRGERRPRWRSSSSWSRARRWPSGWRAGRCRSRRR